MSEQLGTGAPQRNGDSSDEVSSSDDSGNTGDDRSVAVDVVGDGDHTEEAAAKADQGTSPDVSDHTTAPSGSVISEERVPRTAHDPSINGSDPPAVNGSTSSPLTAAWSAMVSRRSGPLRARRVHRVVRQVDPWSVLKLSLLFYFCTWVMVMVAVVLLWGVAVNSGAVESLENALAEILAFEELRFNGDQMFQILALGGLIGVFAATAITAVLALLFNVIAGLTGGIRTTVIEEESARRIVRQP